MPRACGALGLFWLLGNSPSATSEGASFRGCPGREEGASFLTGAFGSRGGAHGALGSSWPVLLRKVPSMVAGGECPDNLLEPSAQRIPPLPPRAP